MSSALSELEDKAWEAAQADETLGLNCLTGAGECTIGEAGSASLTEPGDADMEARQRILDEYVLSRWAARCGNECAQRWNATAGEAAGLVVPLRN